MLLGRVDLFGSRALILSGKAKNTSATAYLFERGKKKQWAGSSAQALSLAFERVGDGVLVLE